jgi:hypothetical protein
MKLTTTHSLLHSLLIFFMLFAAQAVYANSGKAFSIKGKVSVNGETMTLATTLKEGDLIVTGEKSAVKVIMKDGTVLDIMENTLFAIEKYAYKADAPEESSSAFNLLGGAFRYVSGLIAKKDPTKTKLSAGTATIGIRGTFIDVVVPVSQEAVDASQQYLGSLSTEQRAAYEGAFGTAGTIITGTTDGAGDTFAVRTSIGEATVTFPDGSTMKVGAGNRGTRNLSTGATSTAAAAPDPIAAAAIAMAADPTNPAAVAEAIAGMSAADAALVISTLVNNATTLGVSKTALLAAVGNAVKANTAIATGVAYVTSALSPADVDAFKATITAAAPEQAAAIEAATNSGKTLDPNPTNTSAFNLQAGETEGTLQVTLDDGTTLIIETTNSSGTPLTTEEIAEVIEAANSPS